jgi:hypothetical protein
MAKIWATFLHSLRQKKQWRIEAKELQDKEKAETMARNAVDVPGECNSRLSTNRCNQQSGHRGPHGYQYGPLILAPWPNENEPCGPQVKHLTDSVD